MMSQDNSLFYYGAFYHRLIDGKMKEVRRAVVVSKIKQMSQLQLIAATNAPARLIRLILTAMAG